MCYWIDIALQGDISTALSNIFTRPAIPPTALVAAEQHLSCRYESVHRSLDLFVGYLRPDALVDFTNGRSRVTAEVFDYECLQAVWLDATQGRTGRELQSP